MSKGKYEGWDIYKFIDVVDENKAFVMARNYKDAQDELIKNTSLHFNFSKKRQVSELMAYLKTKDLLDKVNFCAKHEEVSIIINTILPF